jgi:hypothetical protein
MGKRVDAITWSYGLRIEGVIDFLKRNGLNVIETSNYDKDIEFFTQHGLEIASHVPGTQMSAPYPHTKVAQNLASPHFMSAFQGESGLRLLKVIRNAIDVSFHVGYSAEFVEKDHGKQDLRIIGAEIDDPMYLADIIIQNLNDLKREINRQPSDSEISLVGPRKEKVIGIETLPYHPDAPELERESDSYLNAGKKYITEYWFIEHILRETGAWLLADIPHWLITSNAMWHNGRRSDAKKYISDMIDLSRGNCSHLHVNTPKLSRDSGKNRKDRRLVDLHLPFVHGNYETDEVLEYAKDVIMSNFDRMIFTYEMYMPGTPNTYLPPLKHAEKTARIRDYASSKLNNIQHVWGYDVLKDVL